MKTVLEVLRKMRALLSDEKKWSRGVFARDGKGFACDPMSEHAACWCVAGAAFRVLGATVVGFQIPREIELDAEAHAEAVDLAWRTVARILEVLDTPDGMGIGKWQDKRSFSEVREALDKTIRAEEAA